LLTSPSSRCSSKKMSLKNFGMFFENIFLIKTGRHCHSRTPKKEVRLAINVEIFLNNLAKNIKIKSLTPLKNSFNLKVIR